MNGVARDARRTFRYQLRTPRSLQRARSLRDGCAGSPCDAVRGMSIPGDGLRLRPVTRELEMHQPLSCGLMVGWSKLPLTGGLAGEASEIFAGAGVLQHVTHNSPRLVDGYPHDHLHVAVNGFAGMQRDIGDLFVEYVRI